MQEKHVYRILGASIAVVSAEIIIGALMAFIYFLFVWRVPNFRIEKEFFLLGLLFLPALSIIYILVMWWKNNDLKKFADSHLIQYLIPNISTNRSVIKFLLFRFGIACLLIALANPQFGIKKGIAKQEGIDIMLALDVSNSMNAEDITPSRLKKAKKAIGDLVNQLHGDRIGIVVFAGEAYVQLPITNDYNASKLFLNSINSDIIETQGTSIGAAIEKCLESFDYDNGANKVIIVITDGEDHEEDALKAAEKAVKNNITVHTIGMGSVEGAPIPIYSGTKQIGFKQDSEQNSVITKLNETLLRQIADSGKGVFVRANSSQVGLDYLLNEIEKIEKSTFESSEYADYEDRFYIFLAIGLILLVADILIGESKKTWWLNKNSE